MKASIAKNKTELGAAAAQAGAACLTHVGNGLPRMIDRFDNLLWPGLADDRLTAMLITDGHHIPAEMIQEDGKLYNPETGYLVGSWCTMRECAEFLKSRNLLTDTELEQVTYHNPLRLLLTGR